MNSTKEKFALIGAGPMGLAMAKIMLDLGVDYQGFELHSDVGGLWDIEGPKSTMYDSAHLISSRKMTEFADFPMKNTVAEYPSHKELKAYFRDFADYFKIRDTYRFNAEVISARPLGEPGEGWVVTWRDEAGEHSEELYRHNDRQWHAV